MEEGLESDVSGPPVHMSLAVLRQVRKALANLNPREVRDAADRPVRIAIMAPSDGSIGPDGNVFRRPRIFRPIAERSPPESSNEAARNTVVRDAMSRFTTRRLLRPARAFALDPEAPDDCVRRVLRAREDLMLPLSRNLYPFRKQAVHRIIRNFAKENALFCLATALPDVLPGILSIPWAVGRIRLRRGVPHDEPDEDGDFIWRQRATVRSVTANNDAKSHRWWRARSAGARWREN